jgi:superfamily II DNA or RNA helicase
MQQKVERPDKKNVNAVIQDMAVLHKTILDISNSDTPIKQAISQGAEEIRQDSALQEMSEMEIEVLNTGKQGIRVFALKSAGITNMAQICKMSRYEITRIHGIGEQTAVKIKLITNKMYNEFVGSARIQINPQKRTTPQDMVVRNLYALRNSEAQRAGARALLSGEKNIEAALIEAKSTSGILRWLFSSKVRKNASVQAYEYLSFLLSGVFAHNARMCAEAYNDVLGRSVTEAYIDFEKKAAEYYTLLEGLGLSPSKPATAGLPDDLIFTIEQYPLDLTHMKMPLRYYQTFGAKYMLNQGKVLLGDEMGLGKTIQALAAIADMKSRGMTHFLVVCPASILINWQRETDKYTNISSVIIHGMDKEFDFEQWKSEGGVGITNFDSLVKFADKLDFAYGGLVVDEAHFIKNPRTQRTKAVISVSSKARYIFFMTGTPLENRVEEMCFLVRCLRPDIAKKLYMMKILYATESFKRKLAPVYLRRVRVDVLAELPELIENEDWLEPTAVELYAYYVSVKSSNFMAMRRVSWDVDVSNSSKAKRLIELCGEARDEGRKIIVFSFFRDTLENVCELLGERALGPITGGVSTAMRQQLVDEFTEAENGKVLVAQVQAGGVGLNIQSASVVIFCEPQIKPSLETQAISRAYRMGQVHNVHVHRLLCVNTIDERMVEMLQDKQAQFNIYADESVIGKTQSENTWIKEVVEQEKLRIATSKNLAMSEG